MVELKPGGAQIPVTESKKKRISGSVSAVSSVLLRQAGDWGFCKRFTWPELTFAKTSGTDTRDRETMDYWWHDPINNCGTHFGSSFLLVFKVASRGFSFCWFSSPRVPGCFVFPLSSKIIIFKFQSIRNLFIETNWTSGTGPGIRSVNLLYDFLCIIGQ